jgi:hypothetical protein
MSWRQSVAGYRWCGNVGFGGGVGYAHTRASGFQAAAILNNRRNGGSVVASCQGAGGC